MTRAVLAALCLSSGAHAAAPTVVAARLDVPRAPSDDVASALDRHLRALLMRQPGVLTPTPSLWDAAIAQQRRQDCDVRDDCLQQLAVLSGSLYAVYAAVEGDLSRTRVVASARIVRRDGLLMPVDGEHGVSAEAAVGARSFDAAASEALELLVAKLQLARLPPTVAALAPLQAVTPASAPPPVIVAPAHAPPATAGKAVFGAGIALLAAGAVTFAVGQQQAATLMPVDGNLPAGQLGAYRAAITLRPVGSVVGGAGLAAITLGIILWALGT
jgi:hypothetical protein